jgi:hypothetical protein
MAISKLVGVNIVSWEYELVTAWMNEISSYRMNKQVTEWVNDWMSENNWANGLIN